MSISASQVKELRDKTGAGMMDCKKALVEAGGDMAAAIDNLRKSGIAKAEKKSGRATKEGLIRAAVTTGAGAMVEVLCETDFVAKNPKFSEYAEKIAAKAVETDGDGDISDIVIENEKESLTNLIATIGENMQLRRVVKWDTDGKVASYLHGGGRIGVMVDVEGIDDIEVLNDMCMHIAAFKPDYICPDCIPAEAIAKEREIASAQMAGKPENIIDKIVSGKINKWYSEVCLVNQPWIRDDKQSLAKLYPDAKVKRFLRWEIGEEL